MFSDSITINNSPASVVKDSRKKKKTNRSAKLKQCKLDARREQWLSQVGVAKRNEKEVTSAQLGNDRKSHQLDSLKLKIKEGLVVRSEEDDHDNSSFSSFSNSPGSSTMGETNSRNNYLGMSSSSSSGSRSGCCSGSITEEEDGVRADEDCLDDWEAMADALTGVPVESKQEIQDILLESEADPESSHDSKPSADSGKGFERAQTPKAWRADDSFRPRSLPSLSKRSFGIGEQNYHHSGPSFCPICCEELDCTDTSFLPCLCGFRLCLFCHKRILEEDGRCPGCRKLYDSKPAELPANPHRFARTFSMSYRSKG